MEDRNDNTSGAGSSHASPSQGVETENRSGHLTPPRLSIRRCGENEEDKAHSKQLFPVEKAYTTEGIIDLYPETEHVANTLKVMYSFQATLHNLGVNLQDERAKIETIRSQKGESEEHLKKIIQELEGIIKEYEQAFQIMREMAP